MTCFFKIKIVLILKVIKITITLIMIRVVPYRIEIQQIKKRQGKKYKFDRLKLKIFLWTPLLLINLSLIYNIAAI